MNTVYMVGDFKVVVITATYGIVDKDGKVVYSTRDIEDAVQTCDDIAERVAA